MANRGRDIGLGVGICVVSLVVAGGVAFGVEALGDEDEAVPTAAAPDLLDEGAGSTTSSPDGEVAPSEASTATSGAPDTAPETTTATSEPPGPDGVGSGTVASLISDVEQADSCEELADTTIEFIQSIISEAEGLSLADLESLGPDGEPAFIADYEPAGLAVDERIGALGCDDADFDALVCERSGRLTTTNAFGDTFRSSFVDESCGA